MRLLLDECVTEDLKKDLTGHDVATVVEAGFKGMTNGELLRAASGNYDVLITVDRSLPFQQNIRSFKIAVVVLIARGITYDEIRPLIPQALRTFESIRPGEVIQIEAS